MADPITPNTPNVNGEVVTMAMEFTSGGMGAREDITNLKTYMPLIDIRIGHPVLSGFYLSTQTNATSSIILLPENEMARAVAADSAGEWRIVDSDSTALWHNTDKDGILIVTYIAFGSQQA